MKTVYDGESRLERIFFAFDGMKKSFIAFGQMMLVDSTCKTNQFGLPLSIFCGVHGDGQTITFGYCLMRTENEATVKWSFECLRDCVGDNAWNKCCSVITDGAPVYEQVIKDTIGHSKHIRCIWHIEQDLEKYLKSKITNWEQFKLLWSKAVNALTEQEFINNWIQLRTLYDISAGAYLDQLFRIKEKFVRCFVKQTCTLGCFSTQRCESSNRVSICQ